MTNTQNEPVEVTQEDRDAMADAVRDAFRWDDSELAAIRRGDRDDRVIVQAFARHRLSVSSAVVDALRDALEAAAHNLETGDKLYSCPGLHAAAKRARAALANTPKQSAGLVEELRKDIIRADYEWHGPFGKEKHRIIPPALFDRILSALEGDRP